jgi:poly-gamma-glutamate synthesis protein (capsule biosynthesis protein)
MLYDSEKKDIVVVLTGDLMLTRRLSVFTEDRFLRLRDIVRNADVAFSNFESTVRTCEEGIPTLRKGTYMTTEPHLLDDVRWFGINLVSCANNHAFDYGEVGILSTLSHLDRAGIPHAGTGRHLTEARSPAYIDTPAGRVALIGMTSKFDEWAQAGEQRPDFRGKPGVNPLGFQTLHVVDRQAILELKRISEKLGLEADKQRKKNLGFLTSSEIGVDTEREHQLLGQRFMAGDDFAVQMRANEKDIVENLRYLREARRQADWVIVSLHCHEVGGATFLTARKQTEVEEWATFAKDFSRRCIDEGADIVVGHGPHYLMGVELYKGKPIFHSLGNLVLQGDTVRFLPAHAYSRFALDHYATPSDFFETRSKKDTQSQPADPLFWESVCAVCTFTSGKLKEILLHPLDLGFGLPRFQRGRPLLAGPEVGKRIIERLARLSKPLGAEIIFRDGCGVIEGDPR